MTIYLSEVDPFILLQPYIWLKSTFFYSMAIYFYSMAIYLAEVNPFIFLRPYIWRRCWSFPIGNLSPLPLHCSMLTLMADWRWSLTTGQWVVQPIQPMQKMQPMWLLHHLAHLEENAKYKYKYLNAQIRKCTNTQMHKYTKISKVLRRMVQGKCKAGILQITWRSS